MNNYQVPRIIELPNNKRLTLWYISTHRHSKQRNEYISQAFYDRGFNGGQYAIMAYQQGHRPSAKASIWGIYRVEDHPRWNTTGNFTLLKGDLTKCDAFAQIADVVKDDPGHIHHWTTFESGIEWYKNGISHCLTAHCDKCSQCLYNERVEKLIASGEIEIKPKDWYKTLGKQVVS